MAHSPHAHDSTQPPHATTTAVFSSAIASSSNSQQLASSTTHNPYGSRLMPMDSSTFLCQDSQSEQPTIQLVQEHATQGRPKGGDSDDDYSSQGSDHDSPAGPGQEQKDATNATEEHSSLVQPAPNPLPEPYIISRPTNHNTPPFAFGPILDMMSPKLLHDTVMSPVPQGKKFMCRIVRRNEGMDKRMYPTYELSLEEPARTLDEPMRQRCVFLLRATKKKRSRGSYYAITSDMDNIGGYDRKATDENYGVLGKLRSNFLGTAFHVYSNGRNPFSGTEHDDNESKNGSEQQQQQQRQQDSPVMERDKGKTGKENKSKGMPVREELGAVIYNPNVLGLKGPRKMTILMNTMTADGGMVERRPTQIKDTLIGRMTDGDMTDLLILRNKSPQWNDETNSFVLNFGGRVSLASVKNFQIVHDNDLDYIIMQFGRTSQDNFTMDCQYPMTPFQAFAFALTSFDAKLACE